MALRGKPRLLHPLLVTGIKMWHLRPSSHFYPKVHFWNTVKLLPQGSQVILLVGEIDCREGLLMAVEKLKVRRRRERDRAGRWGRGRGWVELRARDGRFEGVGDGGGRERRRG